MTLTPLLVVVMEFSQHVIHEQVLTLWKHLSVELSVIVTFKTWEVILNEELNELKLKFASSQKVIFQCDLECITSWPDLISFLF